MLYFFYNFIILFIVNIVKDNLLIYLIFIYFSNFLLSVSKPFQSFTSHLKLPKHTVCLVSFLLITYSYFLERFFIFFNFFYLGIILSTLHFFLTKYENNDNETEKVCIFFFFFSQFTYNNDISKIHIIVLGS